MALVVSLAIYAICTTWLVRLGRPRLLISPVHVAFILYTVYIYVWIVIRYAAGQRSMVGAVSLPSFNQPALWYTTFGALAYTIGCAAERLCHGRKCYKVMSCRCVKVRDDLQSPAGVFATINVWLLGTLLTTLFFAEKGAPILAYSVAAKSSAFFRVMAEERVSSMAGAGYYLQGLLVMLPFVALLLLGHAQLARTKAAWSCACGMAVLVVAAMFALTSRGHFTVFLITIMLLLCHLKGAVSWKIVTVTTLCVIVLFTGSSLVKYGLVESGSGFRELVTAAELIWLDRLSIGAKQLEGLIILIDEGSGVLLGRGLMWDLWSLLPGPDVGFNRWAFEEMYPFAAVPSNVTPTIVGEGYANFGVFGALLFPFILGIVMQYCHTDILYSRLTLARLVYLVSVSSALAKATINGFGAVIEWLVSFHVAYVVFMLCRGVLDWTPSRGLKLPVENRTWK